MSIKELVAKIKSGEVKSYDVVKSYVDTINKKEDKIYTKIDWTYIQGINKCDTIIEIEIYGRNHMSKYILEVCVDSVESAISAYNGVMLKSCYRRNNSGFRIV